MISLNPITPQKPNTIPSGVRLQHMHLGGRGEDTSESLLCSFMKRSTQPKNKTTKFRVHRAITTINLCKALCQCQHALCALHKGPAPRGIVPSETSAPCPVLAGGRGIFT